MASQCYVQSGARVHFTSIGRQLENRWLPRGIPLESVSNVRTSSLPREVSLFNVVAVNASSIWDRKPLPNDEAWKRRVVVDGSAVVRPKPGGGVRRAKYCVDAAHPPLAPFSMVFKPYDNNLEDTVYKCCYPYNVLKKDQGKWGCTEDRERVWSPHTSVVLRNIDPEIPVSYRWSFNYWEAGKLEAIGLVSGDERLVRVMQGGSHAFFFSTWKTCANYQRHANGSLTEVLLYCEVSRITRGVYRLLRPLSFVSALLLAAALASVATNGRIRHTPHGWSLACHAACLLAFNVGQAVYVLAIRESVETIYVPEDLRATCKALALSMYFLLVAAAAWLTAVCVNMCMGFGKLQVAQRSRGGGRKKFLALFAFAWGLPTVMTSVCAHFFNSDPDASSGIVNGHSSLVPRLAETRSCYDEVYRFSYDVVEVFFSKKSATALFYYGPVGALTLANVICLLMTLRRMRFLKRGNSVLRREENLVARGPKVDEQTEVQENANAASDRRGIRGAPDTKSFWLYLKMLLLSGAVEIIAETIAWSTSTSHMQLIKSPYFSYFVAMRSQEDHSLLYRTTGHVTDFFKALCVCWMASPEGGYTGAAQRGWQRVKRWRRGAGGSRKRRK